MRRLNKDKEELLSVGGCFYLRLDCASFARMFPGKAFIPDCVQGLSAQFSEGRLIMLSYAVAGKDKQPAVTSLKKKYAAPVIDTPEGTIWSAGNSTLSVMVGKATEQEDAETLITFMMQG